MMAACLVLAAGCKGGVGQALRSGCLSGCEVAPEAHTSLARDPGPDPGPPGRTISLVWLHHSTGDRILQGGLLSALKDNNIDFADINYGEAAVGSYVIGDHTDPGDFPVLFGNPSYLRRVLTWESKGGRHHDVVMFKSCFPASDITGEELLQRYQEHYRALLPAFALHPQVLFIPMSPPPLLREQTTATNAARARRFARWLTTEYAAGRRNVQVFDLHGALAIREGHPDEGTLAPQMATGPGDSHPSREGARAVTRLLVPWLNRAVRAAGL